MNSKSSASKPVHIFIFSKGRIGRQSTLKYLPPSVIANGLTFVTPKSEVKAHKAEEYGRHLDYFPVPDDIHLSDKRLKVIKAYQRQGGENFLFMDDDLKLTYYNPETQKFNSTRTLEDPTPVMRYFEQYLPTQFAKYEGVGLGCLSLSAKMNIAQKDKIQEFNKKMCCAFGYRASHLLNLVDDPRFATFWGIDTTWNLEVIRNGGTLLTDYNLSWATEFDTAKNPGGAALYRNRADVDHSFLRMMLLHPGVISRGREGVHIHGFLRIAWKDVGKADAPDMLKKGRTNFEAELAHQSTTVKEFLSKLPPDAVPYYKKRISQLAASSPTLF